jgi:hypothetical protein
VLLAANLQGGRPIFVDEEPDSGTVRTVLLTANLQGGRPIFSETR